VKYHILCDDATACGVRLDMVQADMSFGLVGWDAKGAKYRLTRTASVVQCRRCLRSVAMGGWREDRP